MIIDAHTHVWPDALAARALSVVPDLERIGDGTVGGLDAAMEAAGVDVAVCLGVAPPERVRVANDFLGTLDRSRYIGFGSVHPDLSPQENIGSLRANGLRGAKMHPIFQSYSLDDPRVLTLLDALRGEFVLIVHVGAGGAPSDTQRCRPAMVRELVRQLPGLELIACHLGGFSLLEEAAEFVIGLPVHVDTAWPPTVAGIERRRLKELIQRHGTNRVVFASDWPMADIAGEVEAVRSLGLPDDETDAILGLNFERLLAQRPGRGLAS